MRQARGTLRLGVSVASPAPGPHGLHIHAQASCTPPDFASAGAHFNPGARKDGRLNPEGDHAGDLPNLIVGANGSVDTSLSLPNALTVAGAASLLQPGGTALVIHASPNDERTDPSGNSGAPVACAVLERG